MGGGGLQYLNPDPLSKRRTEKKKNCLKKSRDPCAPARMFNSACSVVSLRVRVSRFGVR